ncbi:DUF523 domain-containing protein [Candidatus Dojkabacteria bacterium]|uniref:DUF523 domain-containing protein n=1 Tax=Candidatus Dojkabacteria bacterium TaxID=2099670 RepID=A0A847VCF8_9BACT|nr:DUF523 domain-containing protein [Candidatus Dojkabacteria bacterium]
MRILVSACLLGMNTKYNGGNNRDNRVVSFLLKNNYFFIPLCAEQLGGLPTPRSPAEIEKGFTSKDVLEGKAKIKNKDGEDVTNLFINGAKSVLSICKEFGITHAILQDRSPSCGYTKIYDGTFENNLILGNGILTELLKKNNIQVLDLESILSLY